MGSQDALLSFGETDPDVIQDMSIVTFVKYNSQIGHQVHGMYKSGGEASQDHDGMRKVEKYYVHVC